MDETRKQMVLYITISVLATLVMVLVAAFYFGISPRASQKLESTAAAPAASVPTTVVTPTPAPVSAPVGPTVDISDVSGNDPTIVDVVRKVGTHVYLPKGKVTVGTVVDAESSRRINPVFYKNTKQGDKVLIYDDRAILYDPTIDRVLNMWYFIQSVNNRI